MAGLADPDALHVANIAEVYGSSGIVDAFSQRATFAQALAAALAEGCTGIRVAADNTPLVTGEALLAAWTGGRSSLTASWPTPGHRLVRV